MTSGATLDLLISTLHDKFKIAIPLSADSILTELGIDSLDVINFLFTIEEATGVKISDEDILEHSLERLGQFSAYIDARR
jgi:acyl carrier protein